MTDAKYRRENLRLEALKILALALQGQPIVAPREDTAETVLRAMLEAETRWIFAALVGSPTLTMRLRDAEALIDETVQVVAEMVLNWPDTETQGPILYEHVDGRWWLETLRGSPWSPCHAGPYECRTDAVEAFVKSRRTASLADASPLPCQEPPLDSTPER